MRKMYGLYQSLYFSLREKHRLCYKVDLCIDPDLPESQADNEFR